MLDRDYINPEIFYWRGSERFVRPHYVKFLCQHGLIANPLDGGLVLGPSHDDGGIQILCKRNNEYVWKGEMEGYEFIINPFATERHHKKINTLNFASIGYSPFFEPYDVPKSVRVIDCQPVTINSKSFTKWIGFSDYSQWIVNKAATQHHLKWFDEINKKGEQKDNCVTAFWHTLSSNLSKFYSRK